MTLEEHHIIVTREHTCLSCGVNLTANRYTCDECQAKTEYRNDDDSVSLFLERAEV